MPAAARRELAVPRATRRRNRDIDDRKTVAVRRAEGRADETRPPPPSIVGRREFASSARVTFPVAVDEDWSLVRRWWKDYSAGGWTSITWVLDKHGTIRAVHPGGEHHEGGGRDHARCRSDFANSSAQSTGCSPSGSGHGNESCDAGKERDMKRMANAVWNGGLKGRPRHVQRGERDDPGPRRSRSALDSRTSPEPTPRS